MGILAALVIGAIAGWLAGLIVRGAGFGLIGNIVIGIIGALVASWLLPQLGVSLGGSAVRDIVNATIGAVIVLVILSLVRRACQISSPRNDRPCSGRFRFRHRRASTLKNNQQGKCSMKFTGTKDYVATDDLKIAVNASIVLERPLLIKGEPGTGKTVLAEEVAKALGAPLLTWHIKSTTKAQQGLYEYDAVSRLRDSQLGDARVSDIGNYIKRGKLWDAFPHEKRPVLLIEEIDKADIEFPNDLLLELDRMEFFVYETGENIKAKLRPIVMITSNNEKELPDAFLRRCFFHYIKFPDQETMNRIVDVHFPGIKQRLVQEALRIFFEVREVPGLKKKQSTSELRDCLKLLLNEDMTPEMLRERDPRKLIPPLHGALLKNEQDVHLFERLAFLSRREVSARSRRKGSFGKFVVRQSAQGVGPSRLWPLQHLRELSSDRDNRRLLS